MALTKPARGVRTGGNCNTCGAPTLQRYPRAGGMHCEACAGEGREPMTWVCFYCGHQMSEHREVCDSCRRRR